MKATSIQVLKGVGPKKARTLEAIGIRTLEDLLTHLPREYVRIGSGLSLEEVRRKRPKEPLALELRLLGDMEVDGNGRVPRTRARLGDGTGSCTAVWFHMPFLKQRWRKGQTIRILGRLEEGGGGLVFLAPRILGASEPLEYPGLTPVYPLGKGITQTFLRGLLSQVLEGLEGLARETIPRELLAQEGLMSRSDALRTIHRPDSLEAAEAARQRLAFEEFFFFQLGAQFERGLARQVRNLHPLESRNWVTRFQEGLPFPLTPDQKTVLEEILGDMEGPHAMNRLVQGDVGSGKTVVAACAMLAMMEAGRQAVVMAPTEVLARQHHASLSSLFGPFGLEVGLLAGSMTAKEKKEARTRLSEGKWLAAVGTHALVQDGVEFASLGLVVTDEQHRFGVRQREVLGGKGECPHMLVMSATPIPRTLAWILYGDMDISAIKTMPPGRQEIKSFLVDGSMEERVLAFLEKEVETGRQAYVVCPLVEGDGEEEGEAPEVTDATTRARELQERLAPGIQVGLLHGKMRPKEKQAVMERFKKGEIQVLVSTTVIEVGVDVSNATLMLVENAERFGLAQLHQLRGRVGRGSHQSYCILFSDTRNPLVREKLNMLARTADGFKIAEYDLERRGPGEAFGNRQHGILEFRAGDLWADAPLMRETNRLVRSLLERDPLLEAPAHQELKREMLAYMERNMRQIVL
ncbi:ATP-dependent DNA helicase RecG [Anaerotalea alkaliphila]|uniref:ATP-dependent DNA helicase RecG n=1 Tax=Anaerotalea alkaliphila TaxID=2662126 RepID=A0A7X5HUI6_9FIRM|nr:ATP-dependent DNA helicase RecG [Anaerotalea alkaliphila]NDL66879.1 ATP-dependent DNA helicase RecG [Anaerotalea alkaliphila]